MKISYYPGCTLKNNAKNFEDSAINALTRLGVEIEELPRWNCCGTVFSLAADDTFHQLAPIRILVRAKENGSDALMTLCAMCYNTLKRANLRFKHDPEEMDKINQFMYREDTKYEGDVKILHMLELLRDEIGFEEVSTKVAKSLRNLEVASYYGCLLVRPKEIGFDDVENPTVLDDLMVALGADTVDFPFKTECCGAYQTVTNIGAVVDRTNQIISSARNRGAEAVVVSCPLCAFNIDNRQRETLQKYPEFKGLPVLYFTQLLALALGVTEDGLGLDLHYVDPKPLLREKRLI
jgi:heterodisulfide reductase subunit B